MGTTKYPDTIFTYREGIAMFINGNLLTIMMLQNLLF